MIINNDNDLILKYGNPPSRQVDVVTEIVIHHTAGVGTWQGLKNWFTSDKCERKDQYKRFIGFTHYYIEKNGTVFQPFFLDSWMYHSCSGKHDKETIGIELIHSTGEFTDSQYTALTDLIEYIYQSCPIKTIVSHDYNYMHYSGRAKGCPSKWFNWNRLSTMLEEKGIKPLFQSFSGV
jgi:hypothetical protein